MKHPSITALSWTVPVPLEQWARTLNNARLPQQQIGVYFLKTSKKSTALEVEIAETLSSIDAAPNILWKTNDKAPP